MAKLHGQTMMKTTTLKNKRRHRKSLDVQLKQALWTHSLCTDYVTVRGEPRHDELLPYAPGVFIRIEAIFGRPGIVYNGEVQAI